MFSQEKSIDDLPISQRTYNALRNAGLTRSDLIARKRDSELLKLPNLGRKSLEEIRAVLFYECGWGSPDIWTKGATLKAKIAKLERQRAKLEGQLATAKRAFACVEPFL